MENTSTNTLVQNVATAPVTSTSKTGFAYVIAVITALASGNKAGIPTDISLYVALGILIDHAVMEIIPQPASGSWLNYPYKLLSGLGGNFKWAEERGEGK